MAMQHSKPRNEQGYILLSIMLLMTLMLIALSIEVPRIAQQIKRGKEEELIHRGEQYKIAIKRFLRKNGRYPASLEQLESSNMRFLRKRYKDPMTGKDDWRILHVGEVQLNPVTGGLTTPGQQGQMFGNSGSGGLFSNPASPGADGKTSGGATGVSAGAAGTGNQQSGLNQQPGTQTFPVGGGNTQFGGAGVIGVASTSKEKSIKELGGKDHYNEWPFAYDPRMDAQRGGQLPPGGQGGQGGLGGSFGSGQGGSGGQGGQGGGQGSGGGGVPK